MSSCVQRRRRSHIPCKICVCRLQAYLQSVVSVSLGLVACVRTVNLRARHTLCARAAERDFCAMESAPSGVSATLKAEKANRESLAKQKSAAKVNLDNVLLELDEVQQMKEQAEELEDEDLLVELQGAEQRLQVCQNQKHPVL